MRLSDIKDYCEDTSTKDIILTILSLPFIVIIGPIVGSMIVIGIGEEDEVRNLKKGLFTFLAVCSILMLIGLSGHYRGERNYYKENRGHTIKSINLEETRPTFKTLLHDRISNLNKGETTAIYSGHTKSEHPIKTQSMAKLTLILNKEGAKEFYNKYAKTQPHDTDLVKSKVNSLCKFKAEVVNVGSSRPTIFVTFRNDSTFILNEVEMQIDILDKNDHQVYTLMETLSALDILPNKSKRVSIGDKHGLYQYVRGHGGPKKMLGVDDYNDITIKATVLSTRSGDSISPISSKMSAAKKKKIRQYYKHSKPFGSLLGDSQKILESKPVNELSNITGYDLKVVNIDEILIDYLKIPEEEATALAISLARDKMEMIQKRARHYHDIEKTKMNTEHQKYIAKGALEVEEIKAKAAALVNKIEAATELDITKKKAETDIAIILAKKAAKSNDPIEGEAVRKAEQSEKILIAQKLDYISTLAQTFKDATKTVIDSGPKQIGPDVVEVDGIKYDVDGNIGRHVVRVKNISPFTIIGLTAESLLLDKEDKQLDKATEKFEDLNIRPGESYEVHVKFRHMEHYGSALGTVTEVVLLNKKMVKSK